MPEETSVRPKTEYKMLAVAFLMALVVTALWYFMSRPAFQEADVVSEEMLESLTASDASPAPLSASELESLSAP